MEPVLNNTAIARAPRQPAEQTSFRPDKKYCDLSRDQVKRFKQEELEEAERILCIHIYRMEASLDHGVQVGNRNPVEWKLSIASAISFRRFDLTLVQNELLQRGGNALDLHPSYPRTRYSLDERQLERLEDSRVRRSEIVARHSMAMEFVKVAEIELTPPEYARLRGLAGDRHTLRVQTLIDAGIKV